MLVVAAACGLAATAYACNIPVFRYALERWHPDAYRVTVFHRGSLNESQRAIVAPWEESSSTSPTNLEMRLVDVDAIDDEDDRALIAAQSSPQLPWIVVQYPKSLRIDKTVWAGPLSESSAKQLTASPLRSELIRRLADGQTAVWLMLDSGDEAKDAPVAAQLEEELHKLTAKLKLPELSTSPEDALHSDAPLKVAFSLLRIPRNDKVEQPLVDVLLHSESDLVDFDEPMVFPVFGRGRALLPLIGAGITTDNIQESAAFLVGACSCEIKELNPGFDLLLAADWDVLLFKEAPPADVIVARTAVASGEPELVVIPPGAPPADASAATNKATETPAQTAVSNTDAVSPSSLTYEFVPNYLLTIVGVVLLASVLVFALRR